MVAVINIQRPAVIEKGLASLIYHPRSINREHEPDPLRPGRFRSFRPRLRHGDGKRSVTQGGVCLLASAPATPRSAPLARTELKCDCMLMERDMLAIGKASHSRLQSLEFSQPG